MKALKAEETLRNFAEHWVSEETTSQLIAAVKAAAWDEGAEAAWQMTSEGWNSEYATYTHDRAVSFAEANEEDNPYRK